MPNLTPEEKFFKVFQVGGGLKKKEPGKANKTKKGNLTALTYFSGRMIRHLRKSKVVLFSVTKMR